MRNFNWNSELRFQFKRKRNSPTPYKSNIDVFGFLLIVVYRIFAKLLIFPSSFLLGLALRHLEH